MGWITDLYKVLRTSLALCLTLPLDHLAVEADEVIAMLNHVCGIVESSDCYLIGPEAPADGASEYDLGLPPVVMIDEVRCLDGIYGQQS